MPKNERDYRKKAETFTIFITEHDILKGNLPIYHVDRHIRELDKKPFEEFTTTAGDRVTVSCGVDSFKVGGQTWTANYAGDNAWKLK